MGPPRIAKGIGVSSLVSCVIWGFAWKTTLNRTDSPAGRRLILSGSIVQPASFITFLSISLLIKSFIIYFHFNKIPKVIGRLPVLVTLKDLVLWVPFTTFPKSHTKLPKFIRSKTDSGSSELSSPIEINWGSSCYKKSVNYGTTLPPSPSFPFLVLPILLSQILPRIYE